MEFTREFRDDLTAAFAKAGSPCLNLYAVLDRAQTILFIIAAQSSEEAIDDCRDIGLRDWCLSTTVTRRIQRNIVAEPGVLAAVGLQGNLARKRLRLPQGR